MEDLNGFLSQGIEIITQYGVKILMGLVLLVFGWFFIKILIKVLRKKFSKSKFIDESLEHFLLSLISISLKILLVLSVISTIGIQVTSFIAVLGAAGLAVGLALQGSLSNFAGGVLILILKPFKIGDFIETESYLGTVKKINVFHTILKTPDNKTIILPNSNVSNGNIVNFTREKMRRVDMIFGISYNDNIDKAKKIILDLIKKDERVIEDEEHPIQVVVSKLGESSVDITARVWTKTEDFWNFYFYMQENVKKRFDKNKISIPFPQRDVHIYKK